jgi:alpha-tubulin suppressor-like RCC1 family protein
VLRAIGHPGWGYPEGAISTIWEDAGGTTPLLAASASAGWDHSCAARTDGTVACFGRDEGKSGDGTPADRQHNPPVTTLGVMGAVEVAAGVSTTCARLSGGGVRCWGFGILGDGAPASGARTAVSVSGLSDAVAIDHGWTHACALRASGQVVCWGSNTYGQLGTGDNSDRLSPATVIGLPLP